MNDKAKPVPAYDWLYLVRSRVTHALPADRATTVAVCGIYTWSWWYGTGRQSEYDKAARLPRCKKCVARIGPRVVQRDDERKKS